MKDWYAQRHAEGIPTKNINSMAVMYSVACLLDLDRQRGGAVLDAEWRDRFSEWVEDWGEFIMNDLPSEYAILARALSRALLIGRNAGRGISAS